MITRFCVLAIAALGLAGCASYQEYPGYPAYPYSYAYAGWWDDGFEHFHDHEDDHFHCHDNDHSCSEHEHDHEMVCDHDHGSCFDHRKDPRQDMMFRQRENDTRPGDFASARDHPVEPRFSPNSRPMPPAVQARPPQQPMFWPTAPMHAARGNR